VVGASCTLNISFKHTTGDYLDAEHPLKPLENRNAHKQKWIITAELKKHLQNGKKLMKKLRDREPENLSLKNIPLLVS
jgi:hypothetical protein